MTTPVKCAFCSRFTHNDSLSSQPTYTPPALIFCLRYYSNAVLKNRSGMTMTTNTFTCKLKNISQFVRVWGSNTTYSNILDHCLCIGGNHPQGMVDRNHVPAWLLCYIIQCISLFVLNLFSPRPPTPTHDQESESVHVPQSFLFFFFSFFLQPCRFTSALGKVVYCRRSIGMVGFGQICACHVKCPALLVFLCLRSDCYSQGLQGNSHVDARTTNVVYSWVRSDFCTLERHRHKAK